MDVSTDDTMPDDVWKDSFDKLLDQRPVLRELNVIKRDVRASFNMNSSYENSSYDGYRSTKLNYEDQQGKDLSTSSTSARFNIYLEVAESINGKKQNQQQIKSKIISTPIKNNTTANPFKCTLSPIGPWDLRYFKQNDKQADIKRDNKVGFNATPLVINNIIANLSSPNVEKEIYQPTSSLGVSPFELVKNKWKTKQGQKQVCFASNDSVKKVQINAMNLDEDVDTTTLFGLRPGKWRKTLNCLRRMQNPIKVDVDLKSQAKQSRKGRSKGVAERAKSLETGINVAGQRKSICIRPNSNQTRAGSRSTYSLGGSDFKHQILQRCGQRRVLTFNTAYNDEYLRNCSKIGEGAFGEVFIYEKPKQGMGTQTDEKTVLKVIPIEGNELVNGEVQKTFEQILPEIIISMELSNLNNDGRQKNATSGFVALQRVRCVKGKYPTHLQKLWESYDLKKESQNDHPKCFTNNQQYIILELGYGGNDLEGFHFKNAEQSFAALQQIILSLAVGEREYQFEHRDLHWGNILVLNTNQMYLSYKLEDEELTIPTKGIQITIIDYTLSRITCNDYCFYNDLSTDEELFTASGDYQFEIYRMMRKVINNKWENFEPKTNIFWISYIISKLVEGVTYKNVQSKSHLLYMGKLKGLQQTILSYKSCADCARDVLLY